MVSRKLMQRAFSIFLLAAGIGTQNLAMVFYSSVLKEIKEANNVENLSEDTLIAIAQGDVPLEKLNPQLIPQLHRQAHELWFRAAIKGNVPLIKVLAAQGVDIDAPGLYGATALVSAVAMGQSEAARELIKLGANTLLLKNGKNLIEVAIMMNEIPMLKVLLEEGLNPNMQGEDDSTPLTYALRVKRFDSILLLLAYGAEPNQKDGDERTPLHLAVRQGDTNSVQLLLAYKASPNSLNGDRYTPLHQAVFQRSKDNLPEASASSLDIIEYLILGGANVSLKGGFEEKNTLEMALENKDKPVLKALLFGLAYNQIIQDPTLDEIYARFSTALETFKKMNLPPLVQATIFNSLELKKESSLVYFDQLMKGSNLSKLIPAHTREHAEEYLLDQLKPIIKEMREAEEAKGPLDLELAELLDENKVDENFKKYISSLIQKKINSNKKFKRIKYTPLSASLTTASGKPSASSTSTSSPDDLT